MIQLVETPAGEGNAANQLAVSVVVSEGEGSALEFGRVKDALLDWQRKGRSARGSLKIEIQTHECLSQSTLQEFMNIVSAGDPQMYEFYKHLKEATISTISPSGKRLKTIGFAH